jgi:AraC-like DNA-binding protein
VSTETGNALPAPALVRIYVQEGIASLTAMAPVREARTARHDAIVMLSVPGHGRFNIASGPHAHTLDAVAVSPTSPVVLSAPTTRTIGVAVHLVHPLYKAMRIHLSTPLKPLKRQDFAHLDTALQQADEGRLSLEGVSWLTQQVLDVVLRDAPAVPPLDPRIALIMRTMDADFDCTFEQLAAKLNISTSRLSHLFSKELGVPFRSYITWSRLVLAWEMVALRPEMSFTEIAHIWRFSDSSHMARAFHASLGVTPTTMRDRRLVEVVGRPMPRGQHVPPDAQMLRAWPARAAPSEAEFSPPPEGPRD